MTRVLGRWFLRSSRHASLAHRSSLIRLINSSTDLTVSMRTSPDRLALPRSSVCDLAETERARHRRWQDAGLLVRKDTYGRLDVLRAAALEHVWAQVGPSRATAVWGQIEAELGVPGATLDVVVDPATRQAVLARNPEELARVLPRDRPLLVIDLGARVRRASTRLEGYLATTRRAPSTNRDLLDRGATTAQ